MFLRSTALLLLFSLSVGAQFAPPAGQAGSTALHKDSSIFVAWASHCSVQRGYQDILFPSVGLVSFGDSSNAIGKAGVNGVVSLGDRGYAILTFDQPITNKPGWDFAVFENAFIETFLELAFVEVSSDGINFFRFPATSNTQDTVQIDAFGAVDASKLNNLAGKYKIDYGTPFDLEELNGISNLNINRITHVKIIDVVGSIIDTLASYDINNHIINDPWATSFASGGFDLDAVGVIHSLPVSLSQSNKPNDFFSFFPNPSVNKEISIEVSNTNHELTTFYLLDINGRVLLQKELKDEKTKISFPSLNSGLYLIQVIQNSHKQTKKIILD